MRQIPLSPGSWSWRLPFIQAYYKGRGHLSEAGGVRYNDVLAVSYAIDPGLFRARELHVEIETHSDLTRGQTVADLRDLTGRPPNAKVCLEVDAPRLTVLFTQADSRPPAVVTYGRARHAGTSRHRLGVKCWAPGPTWRCHGPMAGVEYAHVGTLI